MSQNRTVRAVVATIDAELSELSRMVAAGGVPLSTVLELRVSWQELIQLLALTPDSELRTCPRCRRNIMREATRCGFCWMKLQPEVTEA